MSKSRTKVTLASAPEPGIEPQPKTKLIRFLVADYPELAALAWRIWAVRATPGATPPLPPAYDPRIAEWPVNFHHIPHDAIAIRTLDGREWEAPFHDYEEALNAVIAQPELLPPDLVEELYGTPPAGLPAGPAANHARGKVESKSLGGRTRKPDGYYQARARRWRTDVLNHPWAKGETNLSRDRRIAAEQKEKKRLPWPEGEMIYETGKVNPRFRLAIEHLQKQHPEPILLRETRKN